MKTCVMILLIFSSSVISASEFKDNIIGHWVCDPYEHYFKDTVYFKVQVESDFFEDGTSIDIQTWTYSVKEEGIWFSVQLTGPWEIKNGLLVETTTKESLFETSDRVKELPSLNIEKIFKSVNDNSNTKVSTSKILTLSKSSLISQKINQDRIVSCVRDSKHG